MQRWEIYPKPLIDSCHRFAADIIASNGIEDVVGHHDVAILGKFDPGPLFDFAPLVGLLAKPSRLGFKTTVKVPPGETLSLRKSPKANAPVIRELERKSEVHIRAIAYGPRADSALPSPPSHKRYLTRWASVDIDGSNRHAGFVNIKYLAKTPLDPSLAQHL